jgi:hypothetical protein
MGWWLEKGSKRTTSRRQTEKTTPAVYGESSWAKQTLISMHTRRTTCKSSTVDKKSVLYS